MEWQVSSAPMSYPEAVAAMESRVQEILSGQADELVWLLEHPPLYTAGTSASEGDLLDSRRFPVYKSGRGGQYTYHGPGQRIAYVMLDLKKRNPDVRMFVKNLENWIILTLTAFGVKGEAREGRVGVWVAETRSQGPETRKHLRVHAEEFYTTPPRSEGVSVSEGGELYSPPYNKESKIAAIGIRIRKWVTYHGISININPDLNHYDGIIPCGIRKYGVTSLAALGINPTLGEFDQELMKAFRTIFA